MAFNKEPPVPYQIPSVVYQCHIFYSEKTVGHTFPSVLYISTPPAKTLDSIVINQTALQDNLSFFLCHLTQTQCERRQSISLYDIGRNLTLRF